LLDSVKSIGFLVKEKDYDDYVEEVSEGSNSGDESRDKDSSEQSKDPAQFMGGEAER
jgi:hypothetical protein